MRLSATVLILGACFCSLNEPPIAKAIYLSTAYIVAAISIAATKFLERR